MPLDSVATNLSRIAELNSIKEWLGLYDLPEVYPMYTSPLQTDWVPGISDDILAGIGGA